MRNLDMVSITSYCGQGEFSEVRLCNNQSINQSINDQSIVF